TAWLGAPPAKFLASVPFLAGGRVLLAVIPGDLFLNSVKLVRTLSRAGIDTADFHAASAEELNQLGGSYDWISLVRTPRSVVVIADEAVRTRANFVMRSPRLGHFLTNLNSGRDFNVDMFADLATATEGAGCPKCENALTAIGGTEIGHIFKLGARYTAAFGAQIEHAGGAIQAIEMGSYGLGITRLMATVVEQNRDARGIIWPEHVAPYSAIIVPLRAGSKPAADQRYRELTAAGLDVLFDDTGAPSDEKLRNAD